MLGIIRKQLGDMLNAMKREGAGDVWNIKGWAVNEFKRNVSAWESGAYLNDLGGISCDKGNQENKYMKINDYPKIK